jgi:hypothetical protein
MKRQLASVPEIVPVLERGADILRRMRQLLVVCCLALYAPPFPTAQSLGDVARQERERKNASSKHSLHVFTNEDISKPGILPTLNSAGNIGTVTDKAKPISADSEDAAAKELQAKIRTQKQKIHDLEARIADVQRRIDQRESVGNVTVSQRAVLLGAGPGPCAISDSGGYSPYKDWCDEPAKLTAELDKYRTQLRQEQNVLADLQEKASRTGYGNAFYDPD